MKIIDTTQTYAGTHNELEMPQNILVFSHLRWDFVFQRPQHLLTRFARNANITFIEEPVFDAVDNGYYAFAEREESVIIMTPHLRDGLSYDEVKDALKALFNDYMQNKDVLNYAFWYYTPMALEFSRKYTPKLVVYDCMDELSAFKFAPARLKVLEQELLKVSDIVFTGGRSLYEAKKHQHANIFAFPSSIDKKHFQQVRNIAAARSQNANNASLTLGFYGVIDERFDIDLIKQIADARPDWQIILIGPVVKIDENLLPRNSNIKYLGAKNYQELPQYMAEWDIALIPFMLNESTRFISPTKTPEYLAAGLPVVSTAIKDVINPYGNNRLVQIATNAEEFIEEVEFYRALPAPQKMAWLNRVDQFLELNSWDRTCNLMRTRIKEVLTQKLQTPLAKII